MQVYLNDQIIDLPEALTLSQALIQWEEVKGTFAIALNQVFIPKQAYDATVLQHQDRLDIITPMQGG